RPAALRADAHHVRRPDARIRPASLRTQSRAARRRPGRRRLHRNHARRDIRFIQRFQYTAGVRRADQPEHGSAQAGLSGAIAMRAELKRMGLSLDWERELATCHPGYYQHQQKLFLDFFRAGLVYRKEAFVNWDPVDQTVLANEQVIDGKGWRSGAPVEKRKLSQWFFRITAFAQELLDALETLDRWQEKVRLMQKNWIGRSEGLKFQFALSD